MTEVYYLPLKSAGGSILGHARISGGIARLHLRRPVHGQAVILSENGSASGEVREEIVVHGKLSAIAVLEEGRLLCCGIPQGQSQSFADLKKQLERTQAAPPSNPPQPVPCPPAEEPPIPLRQQTACPQEKPIPVIVEAAADTPADAVPACVPAAPAPTVLSTSDPDPADTDTTDTIDAIDTIDTMAAIDTIDTMAAIDTIDTMAAMDTMDAADMDAGVPLLLFDGRDGLHEKPSLADSAADSEAFAALLRRAELVFESIEAPHPPLITGGMRSAARQNTVPADAAERHDSIRPARTAAGTAAQRRWGQEVEVLLGERADARQTPVENPFPHIFPHAVFHRVAGSGVLTHLEGDWQNGGEHLRIYAVPGTYSPQPPAHLAGYTRFIRTAEGSYWVRVTDPV